jgi:hypothetical protein
LERADLPALLRSAIEFNARRRRKVPGVGE